MHLVPVLPQDELIVDKFLDRRGVKQTWMEKSCSVVPSCYVKETALIIRPSLWCLIQFYLVSETY